MLMLPALEAYQYHVLYMCVISEALGLFQVSKLAYVKYVFFSFQDSPPPDPDSALALRLAQAAAAAASSMGMMGGMMMMTELNFQDGLF